MPDLDPVFDSLRDLLLASAASMDVKRDDGHECYVDTRHVPTNG